jgi:hypothetical protein
MFVRDTTGEPMLAITPGDCAAAQLRAADLADDVLPWRDLLHEGPVPDGLGFAELARVRAGCIGALGWAVPEHVHADFAERDAVLAEAAAKPVEIVLWFDLNLVNRLALLQVLDRLAELRGPGLPDVTLAEPRGFGDAGAADLTGLFETRRPVTGEQLAHALGAWAAFRSPDPTALVPYTSEGPLAGLGAAFGRHLDQFPHVGDGLAGTERRALAAVAGGAAGFAGIFRAVVADDDPPWLGDSVLRSHLDRLAAAPTPLLHNGSDAGYRLTDDGRAVLAGRADHVLLNGIDRWLGGVHLTGPAPWRYDPETGRPTR